MNVLIVKTSSMGDVLHALPAITDAKKAFPKIKFDWLVEEGFAEIPAWHPAVNKVIPVAMRRWRKNWFKSLMSDEFKEFRQNLRVEKYDAVVDMQGLVKSAVLTKMARGKKIGLDKNSLWESLARVAYQEKVSVNPNQHAIVRMRQLLSRALSYTFSKPVDYGLQAFKASLQEKKSKPYVLFIHGTSRDDKCWAEEKWCELAEKVIEKGYDIKIPWGSEKEHQRAKNIAAVSDNIEVLPKLNLAKVAYYIANAHSAVAVDTGLGHLAAAFATPCVSLYGPTDPADIGALGDQQIHLRTETHSLADFDVNEVLGALFKV